MRGDATFSSLLAGDVFIHVLAALAFPIGKRFYDWEYGAEPEPFMNNRRIYHARGNPCTPFRGLGGPLVLEHGPAQ